MGNYTTELAVIVPDAHIPHENRQALSSVYNLCYDLQPKKIVQLGDLIDSYSMSTFTKDPSRIQTFQDEIDGARGFWQTLRYVCPQAEMHYTEGNHEERLPRVLCSFPGLASLQDLSIERLMRLEDYGVTYHRANQLLVLNDCLICTHGTTVRSNPAYSALAELSRFRRSGISGHTHRCGMVYETRGENTTFWAECGFLGDPYGFDYRGNAPCAWTTAVAVATFWRDAERSKKRKPWKVTVDLLEAQDNCFVFRGKLYTPEGVEVL